jgi:hypothetical protein
VADHKHESAPQIPNLRVLSSSAANRIFQAIQEHNNNLAIQMQYRFRLRAPPRLP